MTVYQIAGTSTQIDGDAGTSTLTYVDATNPITGGMGVNTVRILNEGTNAAVMTFTPTDTTYEFASVPYTTDSADGADAIFNVTVASDGYIIEIVDGGVDYLEDDTFTILGTDVGGSTTANDLTATAIVVDETTGAVTKVSVTGTQNWPQSFSEVTVLAKSAEFIQVTQSPGTGCYFTADNGDSGYVTVTPVLVVG